MGDREQQLDLLMQQECAQSCWAIDQWGNVIQINTWTGNFDIVMPLCEMTKDRRDQFINEIKSKLDTVSKVCDVTQSNNNK